MSSVSTRKYWFPAKRYGWGWGFPSAWQGRVVLLIYLILALAGIPFIQASKGSAVYIAYLLVLTVILAAICWLTGEPPGAGMNPQPPPQEQVEEANRHKKIKKDSESGDRKSGRSL